MPQDPLSLLFFEFRMPHLAERFREARRRQAPAITLGIREAALTRPDGSEIAARLVAGLTDAVASVLGQQTRNGTSVELVATPRGRAGLGGAITE